MDSLNSDQLQAVQTGGHCLVIACPGSGKTKMLVSKIRAILKNMPSARILCVTFTRSSSVEMLERVIKEIGEGRARQSCKFGTFHAHAIRQLTRAKKMKTLLKGSEQNDYMRRAWQGVAPDDITLEDAIRVIEACKTQIDYVAQDSLPGKLFTAYTGLTTRNGVMDFSDTIIEAVRLMRSGGIPPLNATHLLVDEFQDTDPAQLSWIHEHQKAGTIVTAVGDDDQAIYSWRGAMGYAGMIQFGDACKAEKITLGTNYRCRSEILLHADRLISNNTDRITKRLHANRGTGGHVEFFRYPDEAHQAEAIANYVIADGAIEVGQWAVLARTNALLDAVDGTFTAQGIPFYRASGKSFWDQPIPSLLLRLLHSAQTGEVAGIDHVFHWCEIENDDLETFHGLVSAHGLNALTEHEIQHSELGDFAKCVIGPFITLFAGWRKSVASDRPKLAIMGIADWMKQYVGKAQADNKLRLIKIASDILSKMEGNLRQRMARVTIKHTKKKGAETAPPKGVGLYTVHGAKGLEFDNVWIIGAEHDVFPSPKAQVQEERRLMFVAVTRAKNNLYISSTATNNESQFILEMQGRQI